jgi:hypothetical protein
VEQVVVQAVVVVVEQVRLELLALNHFQLLITQWLSVQAVRHEQVLMKEATTAAHHQSIV